MFSTGRVSSARGFYKAASSTKLLTAVCHPSAWLHLSSTLGAFLHLPIGTLQGAGHGDGAANEVAIALCDLCEAEGKTNQGQYPPPPIPLKQSLEDEISAPLCVLLAGQNVKDLKRRA